MMGREKQKQTNKNNMRTEYISMKKECGSVETLKEKNDRAIVGIFDDAR